MIPETGQTPVFQVCGSKKETPPSPNIKFSSVLQQDSQLSGGLRKVSPTSPTCSSSSYFLEGRKPGAGHVPRLHSRDRTSHGGARTIRGNTGHIGIEEEHKNISVTVAQISPNLIQ